MKNTDAAASTPKTLAPFEKGQIWKVGEINVAVTLVGKTLVHYKRYKTQRHGSQVALTSKPELQQYLLSNNAVLISG